MFNSIRKMVGRKSATEELGPKVFLAELDSRIEGESYPDPISEPSGWVESDGEVCEECDDLD